MLTLERSPRGWLLSSNEYDKIIRLTSKQVRELFLKLNQEKFDDAYLSRKNPNDLIIVIDGDLVNIKDYLEIKDRPYIKEIKGKVERVLLKRMVRNVNKKLKVKGIKVLAATATLTTLICAMTNMHNFKPQPDVPDKPATYQSADDDVMDVDYAFVYENPTLDDIIKDEVRNKQNDIRKYIEYYGDIFSIPMNIQQELYNNNETYLLATSKVEDEVIKVIFEYYFNNMYEQAPLTYNSADDYEQQLTILKYATIKGITDKDVLTTMLAVHQLETGHGNSDYCRDYNNLGGVFVTNPNTGVYEIKKYPNLEVGAIDYVNVFLRIMNRALTSEAYDSTRPIEYNMNPIYCTEKMNPDDPEWHEIVSELKGEITANGLLDELLNKLNTNQVIRY